MAEENIILGIDIDTDKLASQMAATLSELERLKREQSALNKVLKESGKLSEEQAAELAKVQSQITLNKAELKSLNGVYNTATKDTNAYGDSLNEMRRKLTDMQKAYDGMNAEMRDSASGKAFLAQIKEQNDAVLELEKSTGRAQRNVGNYQSAVTSLVPGLDKLNSVLGKAGTSLEGVATDAKGAGQSIMTSLKGVGKAFVTPPIAIITVIVGTIVAIVEKLKEAFNKSDDAGTALASGLAVLEPIGTAIGKVFDTLANIIGKLVEGFGKGVVKIAAFVESLLGIEDGYSKAAEKAQALVKAQDDLEEAERQYTVNSAKREKEISELRNKAKAKMKTNAEQAKKDLQQAVDLEKKNLEDEKKIAAERLRILEERAKKENDTSDDTKNAIAQARAQMYAAEKAYFDGVRELQEQQLAAEREIQNAEKQRAEEAKRLAEERLKRKKELAEKEEDIAVRLQKALIDAVQDEAQKEILTVTLQYDEEIKALKKELSVKKDLTVKAQQDLTELIKITEEEKQRDLQRLADEAAAATEEKEAERLAAEEEAAAAEIERQKAHAAELAQLRIELAEEWSEEELEANLALLDLRLQAELEATELNEEEKYLIKRKYEKKTASMRRKYADEESGRISDAKKDTRGKFMDMSNAASNAFGQMSSLLDEWAESSESASAASKAFALTQILVNEAIVIADTAQAIAAAIAGAASAAKDTGPLAPFMLAANIAMMIGAVLSAIATTTSNIKQAKQLLSGGESSGGNYASGGIVGGTSYTGDNVRANVNSGEMILTRGQQSRLFDIANGAGGTALNYDAMSQIMAQAVSALPAPILNYKEFTNFQKRTTQIKQTAKI